MNKTKKGLSTKLNNSKNLNLIINSDTYKLASPSSWEFYKEEQTKILWVHICTQDLTGVAISINKWWKTRYP